MALYAFDGTWNQDKDNDDSYRETNVVRFHHAYTANSGTNDYYVAGIGTRLGIVGRAIGGAFGAGELPRLEEAYDRLCENWAHGDTVVDVVGFSRGAATTLDFCNLVAHRGVRAPKSHKVVEKSPTFRFIGLWDVVGAFGLGAIAFDLPHLNVGHKLRLPKENIGFCFHAMALDEVRTSFNVIRVKGAREVWFRGVHSDIGGGNDNRGLNDISMRWMMRKAKAAGLPVADAQIAGLRPDPAAAAKLHDKLPEFWRPFRSADSMHYTVKPAPECRETPSGCGVEDEQEELKAQPVGAEGLEADAPMPGQAGGASSAPSGT
jgi:uncharacterized protein (DUF2235 family)